MTDDIEGGAGKQVIARAAAVLRALENQPLGLSLGQISKATGLPRTTVHRMVAALEAQQLVLSGEAGIKLGPAIARLATSAHTDIVAISRPFIEALGRRTRETVDLCVFGGQHAISVAQYASDRELRVVSPVGTAFPVHCTAHGKAMLAALSNDEVRSVLEGGLEGRLEKRTPSTMTDIPVLLKTLETIRVAGHALDHEEHALGVCGVGVTLRTGVAERYALSLAVPTLRFKEALPGLQAALLQCRAEIEALAGAR